MESYTELNCAFTLKSGTPEDIADILLFMTGEDENEPANLPQHPLFSTPRWRHLLRDGGSDGSSLAYGLAGVEYNEHTGRYIVTVRLNLINLGAEANRFIDWITPHILARRGDCIGYKRDQDGEPLTLLIYPNRTHAKAPPDEANGEPA
jgi:hypothetical protein